MPRLFSCPDGHLTLTTQAAAPSILQQLMDPRKRKADAEAEEACKVCRSCCPCALTQASVPQRTVKRVKDADVEDGEEEDEEEEEEKEGREALARGESRHNPPGPSAFSSSKVRNLYRLISLGAPCDSSAQPQRVPSPAPPPRMHTTAAPIGRRPKVCSSCSLSVCSSCPPCANTAVRKIILSESPPPTEPAAGKSAARMPTVHVSETPPPPLARVAATAKAGAAAKVCSCFFFRNCAMSYLPLRRQRIFASSAVYNHSSKDQRMQSVRRSGVFMCMR